jgi:hypothetical protein
MAFLVRKLPLLVEVETNDILRVFDQRIRFCEIEKCSKLGDLYT